MSKSKIPWRTLCDGGDVMDDGSGMVLALAAVDALGAGLNNLAILIEEALVGAEGLLLLAGMGGP